ncbi:MarR family transcriptional regulator, partial [Streptomyces sp. NPDC048845]|uniref:MarR family transcriptional regulator n=1 Tax=Streptomyces sp. NPDC048845 TaxID=3155390 RepID=UPI00343356C4
MHDAARTANLLGATTLALSDLALAGAARDAGVSASGAAALVSLSSAPGLGVTELGRRIGLSQSAAARMVDALVANGLVERSPTAGRQVSVALT